MFENKTCLEVEQITMTDTSSEKTVNGGDEPINEIQTFSLSHSLKERIARVAERQNLSKAKFIRTAIRYYMAHKAGEEVSAQSETQEQKKGGEVTRAVRPNANDFFLVNYQPPSSDTEEAGDQPLKAIRIDRE